MIFYSDGIYDGVDAPADIPWPLEALMNIWANSSLVGFGPTSLFEKTYEVSLCWVASRWAYRNAGVRPPTSVLHCRKSRWYDNGTFCGC
jgi:hypothetical protein